MNEEQIESYKQACELTISIFISKIVNSFKLDTGKEISSITIPMIDGTLMDSLPKTQYIPGQCRIELAEEQKTCNCSLRTKLVGDGCEICNPEYAKQFEGKDIWTCCGGIKLYEDEKCPVCGGYYE